jgi:N-acetylmuramoyl-L-alanine amidase
MRRKPGPGPRHARTAVVALGLALVAAWALSGCGQRAPVPPPVPPAAAAPQPPAAGRPKPGYVARVDSLDSVDGTRLAGRRIAIDPGHGGFFKGSLGTNGTTEAEVNLGVALRLRELLVARGALVSMTRETDRDFLTPADSSLRADLNERSRIANAFAPDLFVSVHHNADPGGRRDVNETQTYYKLGDDGPSYDLANDVHRALVRNVGIETQRLLPGNFLVVRSSEGPALLTETSYLTDPDVEARLRTPEGQQLEAESIYLGIARYFMRSAPAIRSLEVRNDEGAAADTLVTTGRPLVTAFVAGAFDDAQVRIDGLPAIASLAAGRVTARPAAPLAAGSHEVSIAVRLAGEGAARMRRLRFTVAKAPARLSADAPWQARWGGRGPLAVRVRALDADGLPLAGPLALTLRAPRAAGLAPRETTVVATDGVAWGYFRAARARLPRALRIAPALANAPRGARAPVVDTLALGIARGEPGPRTGFALLMPAAEPLRGAPGTAGPWAPNDAVNRDGFVALRSDTSGAFRAPRLAGFRAWGPDTAWPPRYVAIAGGALAGRRIVLDPEGGGDDAAGTGASGTRASSFNLEVARALGGMLAAAGAEVRLTREGDAAVSEVERVQSSETFHAERYLRIGHAAAPAVAGHYFSSANGRRWGENVADACLALGLADSLPVREVAKYALTQASATALYASLERIDDAAGEARLLAPGRLRAEAFALFLALARDFAPSDAWDADTIEVRDADDRPVAGALVTLGGALVLQAGPDGLARFIRTETGPLEAACDVSRAGARSLLLESSRRHLLSVAR